MPAPLVLRNDWLEARFDSTTGRLVHLAAPGGPNLIASSGCQWLAGKTPWVEAEHGPQAQLQLTTQALTVAWQVPAAAVEAVWELPPTAPLLRLTLTIRAGSAPHDLGAPGLPRFTFPDDFVDAFDDPEDCYFDGEELGGGRELPPWRVFFRQGHRDGLLLATRSKAQMSHAQIYARAVDWRPHLMTAYDTNYVLAGEPVRLATGASCTTALELGPWQAERHAAILAAARLDQPVQTAAPPPTGTPPGKLDGVVFDVLDFAAADAIGRDFHPQRWLVAGLPCCTHGQALLCGPSVKPPPLVLHPHLTGVHRLYAGIGNGAGIVAHFSGDAMPTFRPRPRSLEGKTPFYLHLSGPQEAEEVYLGTRDLTGQTVTFSRFPNSYATTVLDYVRAEPLSAAETAAWRQRRATPPKIELSGFNDIPDIAPLTDARDPDPEVYAANLWEHANCGVTKVFWRIDGQCADFPSRHCTMRYVSAKVHGLFTPQAKAYSRALAKENLLALAVRAANAYGLRLYGWQRFNSYMGNVQSSFYTDHPEYHEEWESGYRAGKICLAFPEVRAHKIAILVEAAQHGLHGLCLGFLRHPPVLGYAPILVNGYRERYGVEPPRNRQNPDQNYTKGLPPDDPELRRWWAYRAEFMTTFGRELKAALAAAGLASLPIAIWVRANHCLFDGIDLDTWLAEGLCQEVVAETYQTAATCVVDPAWKARVQARAKLIRGINGFQFEQAQQDLTQYLGEGYDGICTYESDLTVLDSQFIELYESLRA